MAFEEQNTSDINWQGLKGQVVIVSLNEKKIQQPFHSN